MAVLHDKLLGKEVLHDHPLNLVSADPASGRDGQLILNTTTGAIKGWFYSGWQTIFTFTAPVSGGTGSPVGLLLALTYP